MHPQVREGGKAGIGIGLVGDGLGFGNLDLDLRTREPVAAQGFTFTIAFRLGR